ncbi:sensor histidine kinase [Rhizobium sp. C4]|uniref:sensor histidine kinase n=1 Tax=Rhizobium sp. C4 TaxID=1349800 RepID=UPI001E35CD99|nr:HWE histidine kinase domain-containing protein [Rhizobium sp. C4]MCD2173072.1 PAS domain-containing protein [Rhizobium sp. C4]
MSASIENERFVSAALAASEDCIKIIGLDGALLFMSEGGQRVMDVDDFDVMKGCSWPSFWPDPSHGDIAKAIEEAKAGRCYRFSGYANTAKGRRRYWDVKVSPIFAEDGSVENLLSVSRDITQTKEFEDQQNLLRQELSHRIKNILSLVQAAANQTLKPGDDIMTAKSALLARLQSLGRAHEILLKTDHHLATLQAIVEAAFEGYAGGRFTIEGPHVALSPKCGLALALTFHELVTNAIKYGALSNESGHIDVVWTTARDGERDLLELNWTEKGGPAVAAPRHAGFGTKMIKRALSGYIDGDADLQFDEGGLRFKMVASLAALSRVPATA